MHTRQCYTSFRTGRSSQLPVGNRLRKLNFGGVHTHTLQARRKLEGCKALSGNCCHNNLRKCVPGIPERLPFLKWQPGIGSPRIGGGPSESRKSEVQPPVRSIEPDRRAPRHETQRAPLSTVRLKAGRWRGGLLESRMPSGWSRPAAGCSASPCPMPLTGRRC